MIDELEVQDIALIEHASISPSPGMTAITGETGSGKTALLSACRMIMGARADKDLVREGAMEASVRCRLYMDLDPEEDGAVVVDRKVTSEGRSKVRIDGSMASVAELAELVGPTISLCSQHDQVSLVKPGIQLSLLDAWAKVRDSAEYESYLGAFEAEAKARKRLEKLQTDLAAADDELEQARFIARQIGAVDPSPEDYEELVSTLKRAESAELLSRTTREAHDALSGENGVLDLMNGAIALLEEGARADGSMADHASRLRDSIYAVEDVARDLGRLDDAFEFDAASLSLMQERVAAYQGLMRTYGPTIDDLMSRYEGVLALIMAHEDSDRSLEQALEAHAAAESMLEDAAAKLHRLRSRKAEAFSSAMSGVLSDLGMGTTELSCDVAERDRRSWDANGPDDVSFMFSAAPGMTPRPLSKIASGGELGRVMLALHVVMGDTDSISTLVFDEVDSGIGGETATALANVMERLASTHQVMVVTHSAQIAARADRHYLVVKEEGPSSVHTEIELLDGEGRVSEIARMLSGEPTETSLSHARELLG